MKAKELERAVRNEELREKVNKLNEEQKEELIQKLWVTHSMFNNWLEKKTKLVNSKKLNLLSHLLKEVAV